MRICPFCTSVEGEIHFLTECETFRHIRADLLLRAGEILNIRNMKYIESKALIKLLLGREEIAGLVTKYLKRSMELRDFLIEDHRQSV